MNIGFCSEGEVVIARLNENGVRLADAILVSRGMTAPTRRLVTRVVSSRAKC